MLTEAMKLTVLKLALIFTSIWPVVFTLALNFVVYPVSSIECTILAKHLTLSQLAPSDILSLELTAIHIKLFSLTMFHILMPLAFVYLSAFAHIDSMTLGFIHFEVSLILVTRRMIEYTIAAQSAKLPLTLIVGAIRPSLCPVTMSNIVSSILVIHTYHGASVTFIICFQDGNIITLDISINHGSMINFYRGVTQQRFIA